MANRTPAITLALIAPLLTELLSSNIPASQFFRLPTLLFLIVVYGLPVLAIREVSLRWNLGLWGILCLGLAYGIYNEGIGAKTLLMQVNVPVSAFDGYSFLGVNLAWAILIVPWHALHAILYPIAIVYSVFPQNQRTRWLGTPALLVICLLFTLMGVWMFFNTPRYTAAPIYLPVFTAAIIGLVFVSRVFRETRNEEIPPAAASILPALLGFVFYLVYLLGLAVLGHQKLPVLVLLAYAVSVAAIVYRILKTRKWLTVPHLAVFALGDYCAVALAALLSGVGKGASQIVITSAVFIIVFVAMILYLRRKWTPPAPATSASGGSWIQHTH
jgi:hypothetical protein